MLGGELVRTTQLEDLSAAWKAEVSGGLCLKKEEFNIWFN